MIFLILYLFVSVLWGIYSSSMQRKIFGSSIFICSLVGLVDAALAPVSILFAIKNNIQDIKEKKLNKGE